MVTVEGGCYDDELDTVSMIMSVTSVIKSVLLAAKIGNALGR